MDDNLEGAPLTKYGHERVPWLFRGGHEKCTLLDNQGVTTMPGLDARTRCPVVHRGERQRVSEMGEEL